VWGDEQTVDKQAVPFELGPKEKFDLTFKSIERVKMNSNMRYIPLYRGRIEYRTAFGETVTRGWSYGKETGSSPFKLCNPSKYPLAAVR
jgi:hypothetical protein